MQIGAMNHPARDPIAEIEWIGENGFDFVDLTLEPPRADPERIDAGAVRDTLSRHQLDVVAHTAWYIPLGSPLRSVREAALEEFRRALGVAHRTGARVMNAHYRRPPRFFELEDAADFHAETLLPLTEEAAGLDMSIVLEHAPHGGRNQLETFAAILERVPLLRFHLDSGHALLERDYDRFDEYVEAFAGKLLHVHLSDNDGSGDQHLPLGAPGRTEGAWRDRIRKLKTSGYDGTVTLEVFSVERHYLAASRDLLRKWWDES